MLTPILVNGPGRGGTTLLMSHLARDPRCLFDRTYPFETNQLSYLVKIADSLTRQDFQQTEDTLLLSDLSRKSLGCAVFKPWTVPTDLRLERADLLRALWESVSRTSTERNAAALFYAEKVSAWAPPLIHRVMEAFTCFLFRDPRDVLLSMAAFSQKRAGAHFTVPDGNEFIRAWSVGKGVVSIFETYLLLQSLGERRIMSIRYEDLVTDPDTVLDPITEATGWNPTQALSTEHYREHRTTSSSEASVYRWQKEGISPVALTYVEYICAGLISHFGYPAQVSKNQIDDSAVHFADPPTTDSKEYIAIGGRLIPTDFGWATVEPDAKDFEIVVPRAERFPQTILEIWACITGGSSKTITLSWRGDGQDFDFSRSATLNYYPNYHAEVVSFRVCEHPLWDNDFVELKLSGFCSSSSPAEYPIPCLLKWIKFVPVLDSPAHSFMPATHSTAT